MTKTEAEICRDMFWKGYYMATSVRKSNKALEVLRQVLPHSFRYVDESDKYGTYVMKYERI